MSSIETKEYTDGTTATGVGPLPELPPHQQRVVEEKAALSEKLEKLLAFFQSPIFAGLSEAERARLRNQARFMDGYAAVLEERIAAFGGAA